MEEDIKILKQIKEEIEHSLDNEYLKNNRVEQLQPIVDKIIAEKKIQIQVLNKYIEGDK